MVKIDHEGEIMIHVIKDNFELIITKKGYENMSQRQKERLRKYTANDFEDMITGEKVRKTL